MPSLSRYQSANIGQAPAIVNMIRERIRDGQMSFTIEQLVEGKRLDHVAHEYYGDARLWWVIATASGIGWWLQAPPGTRLVIPTDLGQVLALV